MRSKYNSGKWTPARFKGFAVSALRGAFRRWPPKYDALRAAYVDTYINKASGRMAKHYVCAECDELYTSKDVQVDHIKPVVDPKVGFVDYDTLVDRLFCEVSNLQVLCKVCHKAKSKKETVKRKKK